MSKSMSDLMSSPDVGRPEDTYRICVSGKLVKERNAADAEIYDLTLEISKLEQAEASDAPGPRPQMNTKTRLMLAREERQAAAEKSDAIRQRMTDHTVELLLRAKDQGEWRQWAAKNPARDEGKDPTGFNRDLRYAGSMCNIDALIAVAGEYVVKYGNEDPTAGSWDFIAANAAPGDLSMLASKIVGLHEQVVDLGKSRVALLGTLGSALASE